MNLRTNPKLTTNVKLVMPLSDSVFIESIESVPELSDMRWKGFRVTGGDYEWDLQRFWNGNLKDAFRIKEDPIIDRFSSTHDQSLDTFYWSGVERKNSKFFKEKLSFFTVFDIHSKTPDFFAVFRLKGIPKYNNNKEFLDKVLNNGEPVLFKDLRKTKQGDYIRNYQNRAKVFQNTIRWERETPSILTGIDLLNGGIVQKEIWLYEDWVLPDKTLTESDDFLTDLYRRNGLANQRFINIEWLFEEPTEINFYHYFGCYLSFENVSGLIPNWEKYTQSEKLQKTKLLTGFEGSKIYFSDLSGIGTTGVLRAIQGVKDDIFPVKNVTDVVTLWQNNVEWNRIWGAVETGRVAKVETGSLDKNRVSFKIIGKPSIGDQIQLFYLNNNNYCLTANDIPKGTNDFTLFSINGDFVDIAKSISNAINSIKDPDREIPLIRSFWFDDTVVIETVINNVEYNRNQWSFFTNDLPVISPEVTFFFSGGQTSYDSLPITDPPNTNIGFLYQGNFTSGEWVTWFSEYGDYIYAKDSICDSVSGEWCEPVFWGVDTKGWWISWTSEPNVLSGTLNLKRVSNPNWGVLTPLPITDFGFGRETLWHKPYWFKNETGTTGMGFEPEIIPENSPTTDSGLGVSEWDRLQEDRNFLLGTDSKIVPYINRWIGPVGAIGKPVRITPDWSFDNSGMQPDYKEKSVNPYKHTHDWYFVFGETASQYTNFGVLKPPTSLNEWRAGLTGSMNYLTNIFTKNAGYSGPTGIGYEIPCYEILQSDSGWFGGYRFSTWLNRDKVKVNRNITTIIKNQSDFYDYKFSAILISDPNIKNYSIDFHRNINQKWILCEVSIEPGGTGWNDLTLNRAKIYSAKNNLISTGNTASDINISGIVNKIYGSNHSYTIELTEKNGVEPQLLSQITQINGTYEDIIIEFNSLEKVEFKKINEIKSDRVFICENIKFTYDITVTDFTTEYILLELKYTYIDNDYKINYFYGDNSSIIINSPYTNRLVNLFTNSKYSYIKGGIDFYQRILPKISFASIYELVNTGDPFIRWFTHENGITTENDWYLEFIEPDNFINSEYIEIKTLENGDIDYTPKKRLQIRENYRSVSGFEPYIYIVSGIEKKSNGGWFWETGSFYNWFKKTNIKNQTLTARPYEFLYNKQLDLYFSQFYKFDSWTDTKTSILDETKNTPYTEFKSGLCNSVYNFPENIFIEIPTVNVLDSGRFLSVSGDCTEDLINSLTTESLIKSVYEFGITGSSDNSDWVRNFLKTNAILQYKISDVSIWINKNLDGYIPLTIEQRQFSGFVPYKTLINILGMNWNADIRKINTEKMAISVSVSLRKK